jgi:hypothetical protein
MAAAFRGLLLVLVLFVSFSGYAQTQSKVFVTKTGENIAGLLGINQNRHEH